MTLGAEPPPGKGVLYRVQQASAWDGRAGRPRPPPGPALTVLDDRDVDRRGAGDRHERLLGRHSRRATHPTAAWPARPQLFARRPISVGTGTRSTSQPMNGIGRRTADSERAERARSELCPAAGSAQARSGDLSGGCGVRAVDPKFCPGQREEAGPSARAGLSRPGAQSAPATPDGRLGASAQGCRRGPGARRGRTPRPGIAGAAAWESPAPPSGGPSRGPKPGARPFPDPWVGVC